MPVSFLSPARTVLLISDDALLIYEFNGRGVKMVEAVPWSAEDFEINVAATIAKDCGGKPVVILNDMVEQHYRKEKIPRVGALDKRNIVKRKLEVAFPNYPVRAALPLKEKVAKTDKDLGSHVYIFAAVPVSDVFSKTMAAAQQSLAPIVGFYLLPVESSDMIKKLSTKVVAKGDKNARWTIFIGQHFGGGLRQIVVKDGELALTRMTPVSENVDDIDLWAKDVHQEFQATMSYLSRFGFNPDDGLNVILVSGDEAGDRVEELIDAPCQFYAMSVAEMTEHLKISVGVQDVFHHADPLHVAWIARKSKFILPMKAKQIDQVSKPRQVALIAMFALFVGMLFQGYQSLSYISQISGMKSDIETITHKKNQLQIQHDKEVSRKEELGFDIKLIQSSLSIYDRLEKKQIQVLPLLYNIGFSLGRDIRIDQLDIQRVQPNFAEKVVRSVSGRVSPLFIAKMQLTFPSTTDAEKGNGEVKDLRTRLQSRLPDHVVKVSKLLEDYEYSESIVVETGSAVTQAAAQDYVAEITVEGPMVE